VTLINTGVLTGYRWHKFARVWRTPVLGELMQLVASRWRLGKLLNADNPRPLPPEFLDRIYGDLDRGQKRAVLRLYRATSDLATLAEHAAAALGPLHLPALVVWGAGDVYVPVKFAEQQRRYFQVQAVHALPGCGHWPFIDEPERVAELVVPFLRERLAGA
jgi:pimeloyl-ACP methyl ester carboxylesterase